MMPASFKSLVAFFSVFYALTRPGLAEEQSILDGCGMSTFDVDPDYTYNSNALCDGGFKSRVGSTQQNRDGRYSKEQVILLQNSVPISSSFVSNTAFDSNLKQRMGKSALHVGDDNSVPFSTSLVKCTQDFYDTGFHKLDPPCQGKFVSLRRDGDADDHSYSNNEVRLYQSTNLMQELVAAVTISAPPPTSQTYAATNLIQNYEVRSSNSQTAPLSGLSQLATFNSCFQTSQAELSASGHMFVLTINLGSSFFQHSILVVQDLFGGKSISSVDPLLYFQNYELYIGDSPNYAANPKCPGGPYMQTSDSNSFVFVTYNFGGSPVSGDMWKFGREIWCNMQGQYMTIVADLNHLAGQTSGQAPNGYVMGLCNLAIFGARYKRTTPVPSAIEIVVATTATIDVEKITSDAVFRVVNTLNITLRQKPGQEYAWVTFFQETLVTRVQFAPDIFLAPGVYTVVLESYDLASGVKSTLMTDTIVVTVLPVECGAPLKHVFETTQPIVLIKEYNPTVFFPASLFSGPHTYQCGGVYTQGIVAAVPVNGVTITDQTNLVQPRPSLAIAPTAPAGISFSLTFTGRYMHPPTSTDITATFTQTYQLRSVFSPDYLDQPTISHSLTAAGLTFTVLAAAPGSTPPTHSLQASQFTVAYLFKAGTADSLGFTPPAIVPVPYSGFTSADFVKGQPSLGTTSLQSPQGVLNLQGVGSSGSLDPMSVASSLLTFTCDAWTLANESKSVSKVLSFTNSVVSAFTASLAVQCSYQDRKAPTFDSILSSVGLEAGVASSWTLPNVIEGSTPVRLFRFEPAQALAGHLSFDQNSRVVTFDGSSSVAMLSETALTVNYTLVDDFGIETQFVQTVKVMGCSVGVGEVDTLAQQLGAKPIDLAITAGMNDVISYKYRNILDNIVEKLVYKDQREKLCGAIQIRLVTQHAFLKQYTEGQALILEADQQSKPARFEDSFLNVTVSIYSFKIPIRVEFKSCTVTSLSFSPELVTLKYQVGAAALKETLPPVVQKPACRQTFSDVELKEVNSTLTTAQINSAIKFDKASNTVLIATDDFSFAGQLVVLTFSVNSSETVTEKRNLYLQVVFMAETQSANARAEAPPEAHKLVELDVDAKSLEKAYGIADFNVPLVSEEQKKLLALAVKDVRSDQIFMSVPLAARLTRGVDYIAELVERQQTEIQVSSDSSLVENRAPEARFGRLSSSGELTIQFSKKLKFPIGTREDIQSQNEAARRKLAGSSDWSSRRVEVFAIRYFDSEEYVSRKPLMQRWDLVSLEADHMVIQCFFFEPLEVSQDEEPDWLIVQLELSNYPDYHGNSLPESVVKQIEIPRQLVSPEDAKSVRVIGELAGHASESITLGNLLMEILVAGTLYQVWSMINSLQIVQRQSLFNAKIPSNVVDFVDYLTRLGSLYTENFGAMIEGLVYFPEQGAISVNFQTAGYLNSYFLVNQQQPLFLIVGYIVLATLWALGVLLTRCCPRVCCCRAKLEKLLFWNGLIRVVTETFADLTLFAMLDIRHVNSRDDLWSVALSRGVAIGELSFSFLILAVFFGYTVYYCNNWESPTYLVRAGSFLAGTRREKKDRRCAVLLVPCMFYCRRLALGLTLVFWDWFFWGQVALQFLASLLMIILVHWARPLESGWATWVETFNEVIALMILYLLMNFSDFTPDVALRYRLGFVYISTLCLFSVLHLSKMLYDVFYKLKLLIRRCKNRGCCCCKKQRRKPFVPKTQQAGVCADAALIDSHLSVVEEGSVASSLSGPRENRVVPSSAGQQSTLLINTSGNILINKNLEQGEVRLTRPQVYLDESDSWAKDVDDAFELATAPQHWSSHQVRRPRITIADEQMVDEIKAGMTEAQLAQENKRFDLEDVSKQSDSNGHQLSAYQERQAETHEFDLQWAEYEREIFESAAIAKKKLEMLRALDDRE